MKIPEQIKGINKIRDFRICKLFLDENLASDEIAVKVNLCASRIRQILYRNRDYLRIDKNWEKIKQISRVKRQIAKKKDSKKDVADLEELLRKILDGDKPIFKHEEHLHITNIRQVIEDATNRNRTAESIASPESLEK